VKTRSQKFCGFNALKLWSFIAALLLFITANSQSKPLQIGDTLPADILASITTNRQIGTNLPELVSGSPNQLIILDFWATWCTACIKGFGKLYNLQQQFPQLKVLLVNAASTGDDETKIKAFIAKRQQKDSLGFPFPTIIQDTLLKALFPYELLPHYVWVHKGIVVAITGADELTAANIQKVLSSGSASIQQKNDQDASLPLFTSSQLPLSALQQYAILIKGKYSGLGSGNHLRRTGNFVHGHAITNSSLLHIYKMIASKLIPGFNDKHLHLQFTDSSLLFPPTASAKEDWNKENFYTIDYIVPPSAADSLYQHMLSFLNNATGWQGSIITKSQQVFVVNTTPAFKPQQQTGPFINKLHDKQNPHMQNGTMADLLTWLNKQTWLALPVISNTDKKQKISIQLPPGISSLPSLNEALKKYGLHITQQQQSISIFQLTQPQNKKPISPL
jgi:thiol-disulfide isomerase/thioredoxin